LAAARVPITPPAPGRFSMMKYRHGERTKAAIAEQRKLSALLKMLRAGLT
jgi:hypothetical protein